MIDNDIEMADGELRSMLASMVNDPLINAIRVNGEALGSLVTESVKSESNLILRQLRETANYVKELPDEFDTVRSKVDRVLKGADLLKTTIATSKSELECSLSEIVSCLNSNANAVEAIPAQVRQVIAEDFADARSRLDEAVAMLKSATEIAEHSSSRSLRDIVGQLASAEKSRADSKNAWNQASRGLRLQVRVWAALSVLEAIGIAALLFRSFVQ